MRTNLCAFTIVALISGAGVLQADPVAYASRSAYYLSTINPVSGAIQKLHSIGGYGGSMVISPDGTTAYLAGTLISVINLTNGLQTGTITPVADPTSLTLSADGTLLYAINGVGDALYVVSTASGKLIAEAHLHATGAYAIAVTPDNSQIYVTGLYGVTVVSGVTYTVTTTITIEGQAGEVMSPDGKMLYVASQNTPYLAYFIDTGTNTIAAAIPNGGAGVANEVALSRDGATLYVQSATGLVEVSTAGRSVIGRIPTPAGGLSHLAVSSDGNYVYEDEYISAGLLKFNLAQATVTYVPVGGVALALATSPADLPVYFVESVSSIVSEDPVSGKLTHEFGPVTGSAALTLSRNGDMLAGVGGAETPSSLLAVVSLINTSNRNVKTIAIPSTYVANPPLVLTSDAALAFTVISNPPFEIAVIDTAKGSLQQTVLLPGMPNNEATNALAISPDDSTLYALGVNGTGTLCSLSLIDFAQSACVATAPGFGGMRSLVISADGSRLYIPTFFYLPTGNTYGLVEYEAKSLVVTRSLSIAPLASNSVNSLVYSAGSDSVYLANVNTVAFPYTGSLVRVDLGTFTTAATELLSYGPSDIGVTPDGKMVLVVGSTSGTQIFEGTSLAPTASVAGGNEISIVVTSK